MNKRDKEANPYLTGTDLILFNSSNSDSSEGISDLSSSDNSEEEDHYFL
jgi:hypothetical protein